MSESPTMVNEHDAITQTIQHYIDQRNREPKPFVWTASVEQIIDKVSKGFKILATLH